jgi:hypothetical protein
MDFSFEKVGPYLKDPLILIGFFLLLAFGLFRLVIKKGLIPKLQQKHGYEVVKLILWFAFIIGVLLILLGFPLKRRELLNQPQRRNSPDQPFLLDVEVVWPMLVERKQLGFWVAYESKYGKTLSPVHLGLYVRFVNLQSKPLSIETLGTEFHQFSGENWNQLFPIHPYGGIFYLPAPDLRQAAPVAFSAGDLLETLRTRQIQPHETVRGWLFYEMAEGFKNCLAPERLYSHAISVSCG